jgi:ADP-ribose pyrophosphatase YjhB (NUDIX family)
MYIINKIKQIQSLSEIGIHYSKNDFDLMRYQEIGELCLGVLSQMTGMDATDLRIKMIESNGYKTPKVDVRAVIFNDRQELLLVKEKIDGCWSLPGGWADIGYSPSEVAEKESREEAGAEVKATRLIGIYDKRCHNHPPDIYYVYKVFIECRLISWVGADQTETSDFGFFGPDNLPPLSSPRNTTEQILKLFEYQSGKKTDPFFD